MASNSTMDSYKFDKLKYVVEYIVKLYIYIFKILSWKRDLRNYKGTDKKNAW